MDTMKSRIRRVQQSSLASIITPWADKMKSCLPNFSIRAWFGRRMGCFKRSSPAPPSTVSSPVNGSCSIPQKDEKRDSSFSAAQTVIGDDPTLSIDLVAYTDHPQDKPEHVVGLGATANTACASPLSDEEQEKHKEAMSEAAHRIEVEKGGNMGTQDHESQPAWANKETEACMGTVMSRTPTPPYNEVEERKKATAAREEEQERLDFFQML